MSDKPLILVLCTGNSARSQMAEAFLNKYQGDRFAVASAGTEPKPVVHPLAVRAMQEVGIDITHHRPKDLEQFLNGRAVANALIVCDNANQSCPRVWPGLARRTFMPFDDPAAVTGSDAQQLDAFRRVRDEIEAAIRRWNPDTQGATV